MGIMGAGIVTAMGSVFSPLMMLTHFFQKKNTLHLEKPTQPPAKLRAIGTTGFSTFFIDVAMGIPTMIFNRQILKYLGMDALSVYGMIAPLSSAAPTASGRRPSPLFPSTTAREKRIASEKFSNMPLARRRCLA